MTTSSNNFRALFMKSLLAATQCIVLCLACISTATAQTPDAESGIWSGTVVIKRIFVELGYTKTSTLTVTGYVGHPNSTPGFFQGLITNLDSRENVRGNNVQTIWVKINTLVEGGTSEVSLGDGFETNGTITAKTLRFTKKLTTNKMVSLTFKAKGFDTYFSVNDIVTDVTVNLKWKKSLPVSSLGRSVFSVAMAS
jgi:hypothetical protein